MSDAAPTVDHPPVTTAEGFTLHTTTSGTGDPVLLALHGGPGGGGGDYLAPLLELGGEDRRVVTFDQLGTGRSEVPPEDYRWTMEGAAADVDAVRAAAGVEQVDLLGHSYGGILALQYALDFPERVRRLVLASTTASVPRITLGFLAELTRALPADLAAGAITADALGEHDDPHFQAAVRLWLTDFMSSGDGALDDELVAEAHDAGPAGRGLWGDRLWFASGALRGWDVEPRLGSITVPTLLVHGTHDSSDRTINEPIAAGLPDCTWIVLADLGHDLFNPPERSPFLATVRSFLDRPDHGGTRP